MKNIFYIALSDDGSSFYRSQGVFPHIKESGLRFTDISDKVIHSWAAINGADMLILQRPYSEYHVGIIGQAQMMGIRVIIDLDDLLTDVPKHNPAYSLYQHNKNFVLQSIRMADEIWVSTDFIKQELSVYNKNIQVIPNALNDYIFKSKPKFNFNNKTVFYRGGSTHQLDLLHKTSDLAMVMEDNPDWRFLFLGIDDDHVFQDATSKLNNVFVTNKIPIIQYYRHIEQLNAPIMICPLDEHKLNMAKSNISWIEGTFAGSAFFGKKSLPEFNMPEILDFGDFINSTYRFTRPGSEVLLKSFHDRSWEYISKNLLLSIVNKLRVERLLA